MHKYGKADALNVPDVSGKLTPLGNVVVETNRETGHVTVTLRPRDGVNLFHVLTTDGGITLDMWDGPKVPSPGDEVTINGSTFEVSRVYTDPDGSVWVEGEGHKERVQ